jgi:hypothetical protein
VIVRVPLFIVLHGIQVYHHSQLVLLQLLIQASCIVTLLQYLHSWSSSIASHTLCFLQVLVDYLPTSCSQRRIRVQQLGLSCFIALHLPLEEKYRRLSELSSMSLTIRSHVADWEIGFDDWNVSWHVLVVSFTLFLG